MRNKLVLLVASVSLAAAFSCSNDDIDNNGNEISEEAVIANDGDAVNLVKGILKTQGLSSGGSFLLESLSDAAVSFEDEGEGEDSPGPLVSRFALDPTNWYVGFQWGKQTGAVAQANEAIEKISAIVVDGIIPEGAYSAPFSNEGKNQALGGAYFARGIAYFYLVQLWGEVPLYTSTATTSGGSRASVASIYEQVEKDLKQAEALLPETSSTKSYPNKLAADAVLAKVYLTWATVAEAGDAVVTADAGKLASAVTYANKVITSGQYELESDFLKIQPGRNNKFGKEHIYNIAYVLGEDGPNDGGNHQAHCAFSYGFDVDFATQPTHIGPASWNLYNKWDNDNLYKQYDQRREFSYTAHLAKPNTGATPAQDSVYSFTPELDKLPVFGKGIDRSYYTGPLVSPTERDMDRLEIRYADVLLVKAEALIESGTDLSTAKELINTIRRRAYQVGEFAGSASNGPTAANIEVAAADQASLRLALRNERALEFVYEQKRWLDLVRWHNLGATVKSVANFDEYTGSYASGSFLAKVKSHLTQKVTAITANEKKFYRFPIPETAREANPNLTQNTGY